MLTIIAAATFATVLAIGFVTNFIRRDRALDALPDHPVALKARALSPNTLDVGVVGDSWVSKHKLDAPLMHSFDQIGLSATVNSSGQPGAKSRQIYRNLHKTRGEHSSQHILAAQPDYLIIVAGVNDTAGHIGRSFYAHHVLASVKLAQAYGAHPVVVEVPEYGIEHTRAPSFMTAVKRPLYRLLFDGSRKNVIGRYRERLHEFAALEDPNEVSFFPFDSFIRDYDASVGMYSDTLHLSDKGSQAFAAALSEYVSDLHKRRLGSQPAERIELVAA